LDLKIRYFGASKNYIMLRDKWKPAIEKVRKILEKSVEVG
jgi:hypothetical protein